MWRGRLCGGGRVASLLWAVEAGVGFEVEFAVEGRAVVWWMGLGRLPEARKDRMVELLQAG